MKLKKNNSIIQKDLKQKKITIKKMMIKIDVARVRRRGKASTLVVSGKLGNEVDKELLSFISRKMG